MGTTGPSLRTRQCQRSNRAALHDDDLEFTSVPRKSRLGAAQLQAQLSRLSDRTQLRRLKKTLYSMGTWQQVMGIEDWCHTQVSHRWLYHLDACAGRVLTPHDYITNVQKRPGIRAWTGFDCVVPSQTLYLSTEKLAAPLKPLEDTMFASMQFKVV